jgi:hypothetical protein
MENGRGKINSGRVNKGKRECDNMVREGRYCEKVRSNYEHTHHF